MLRLAFQYFKWHYWERVKLIIKAWENYLVFNPRYFSMSFLSRTLFSYWRQYHYSYGRGLDLQRYFEAFTFNMISRILGAISRLLLLFIGAAMEVLIFVGGLLTLVLWLTLPFLLLFGVWAGFYLVI